MNPVLAFCLFKYFPHGGLQRDFMRIALQCQQRGAGIRVYIMSWEGEIPAGFDVRVLQIPGASNHIRARRFSEAVWAQLADDPVDLTVGFNKMAWLDIYFAADTCFADKCSEQPFLFRLTPRSRIYLQLESAVFGPGSKTGILLISPNQKIAFQRFYKTANERMTLLPPGVDEKFFNLGDSAETRCRIRREFGIGDADHMLLQVGSSFDTKGVDRVIRAVAALPAALRERTFYVVAGRGKEKQFGRLARQLGVRAQVHFAGVRPDVECLMQAADLLAHPARTEAAGMTLVESIAVGLPVLCSGACGYAVVVEACGAGRVLGEPFVQETFNTALVEMLEPDVLRGFSETAKERGSRDNLSGLAEAATDVIMKRAHDFS